MSSMNLSKCPFDCVMPPQHVFQCLMQDCLGELNLNYCLIYMDDIVIYLHGIQTHLYHLCSGGSRIFPRGVRQLPKLLLFFNFFAKNCMKMKEFGPRGGACPWRPPWIHQCYDWSLNAPENTSLS